MTLPIGTRVGVYEVTAPIGEGGMGQVYRAILINVQLDDDAAPITVLQNWRPPTP